MIGPSLGEDATTHEKVRLRNRLKELRAGIPEEERAEKSMQICSLLLEMLIGYETVMVYVAKEPEVETMPLIRGLLGRGTQVVVPIIERETHTLRLSHLLDTSTLVPSTFNVPEPVGSEIPADLRELEAAVIPLIGFDSRGHRLGYGAGYYDRFLEQVPDLVKIGAAFSVQQVDRVPSHHYDVRLDYVVTEQGIMGC